METNIDNIVASSMRLVDLLDKVDLDKLGPQGYHIRMAQMALTLHISQFAIALTRQQVEDVSFADFTTGYQSLRDRLGGQQ